MTFRNCLIGGDSQGSPGGTETQRRGVPVGPRGLPKGYAPEPGKVGHSRREQHGQRLGLGSSMVWEGNYKQFGKAGNESKVLNVKNPAWSGGSEGL